MLPRRIMLVMTEPCISQPALRFDKTSVFFSNNVSFSYKIYVPWFFSSFHALTYIVPPEPKEPRLSRFPSTVYMGDTISGNCTSFRSNPPANITFYINDDKVTVLLTWTFFVLACMLYHVMFFVPPEQSLDMGTHLNTFHLKSRPT